VLSAVGVGSVEANALSAALTWVFRDGFAMFGSLVFAYHYSNAFEIYIKEFRYLADVLNNIGLTLDLLSSHFPQYNFIIISCSTLFKSLCGLIAGATKARISAHFASPGTLADVTAKESTQETAVSLIGLILGMGVAKLLGDQVGATWITFILLMVLHLYSNYCLVRVLIFETLNPQRCYLITRQASIHNHSDFMSSSTSHKQQVNITDHKINSKRAEEETCSQQTIALTRPFVIARQENLLLPFYLLIDGPVMGASMSSIISTIKIIIQESQVLQTHYKISSISQFMSGYLAVFQQCMFLIGIDLKGRVMVCLQEGITVVCIVRAYFISYYVYLHINKSSSNVMKARDAASVIIHLQETLIPQAFRWYDNCMKVVLAASAEGVHHINGHPNGPSSLRWDVSDASGLYCGSIRYRNMKEKIQ